ncbi:MAG: PAS domain-containing protein [Deltaproteobacteria bacterium]|nr:PAS domain-containing protein [Deltaproteobacteria bacterium]
MRIVGGLASGAVPRTDYWLGHMAQSTDKTLAGTRAAINPVLGEEHRVREEDLRRREAELQARQQVFTDFVENATVGLHQVGPDGTIIWANQAELRLLGYAGDEYIGRSIVDFHVDADVIADILMRLTRGEELHDYEARLRAKDGTIKHVLISSNVNTHDGKFLNTRCFTRDITEQKRADEALRQREKQLQEITDALPALVAFVDANQRYRFVNAAYERWFAVTRDQIVGKRIEELVDAVTYGNIQPSIARALAGEQVSYQAEAVSPALGVRQISATYMPQCDPDGHVMGFVALVSDVTDRKTFEDERAASEERRQRLLKITSALADAVTTAEVFEAIVDHAGAALNATSSALWLLSDDGRSLRLVRHVGYSAATARSLETLALDMEPSIPAVDAVRGGVAVWVPSQQELVRAYPHLARAVTPGRSYRVCCLPLVSNGNMLGSFGITIEEARDATEDERSFLLLVARHASQALVRLRLLEAERRSRTKADAVSRRMSVLSQASRSFGEIDIGHEQRLDKIVREVGS